MSLGSFLYRFLGSLALSCWRWFLYASSAAVCLPPLLLHVHMVSVYAWNFKHWFRYALSAALIRSVCHFRFLRRAVCADFRISFASYWIRCAWFVCRLNVFFRSADDSVYVWLPLISPRHLTPSLLLHHVEQLCLLRWLRHATLLVPPPTLARYVLTVFAGCSLLHLYHLVRTSRFHPFLRRVFLSRTSRYRHAFQNSPFAQSGA